MKRRARVAATPRKTLRDEFALAALPNIMQSDTWLTEGTAPQTDAEVVTNEQLAQAAYEIADALMAARKR